MTDKAAFPTHRATLSKCAGIESFPYHDFEPHLRQYWMESKLQPFSFEKSANITLLSENLL